MPSGIQGSIIQYIVTGTPRSGTGFTSQLLTSGGLKIGHEMFFGMPGAGFYPRGAVGDCSWLAVPYLRNYPNAKKIHIVRNPLKTISSMLHARNLDDVQIANNMYCYYKVKHLPEIMQWKGLNRYLFFWTVWNNVAEKECEKRFKLENIAKNPAPLFKHLGINTKGKKLYKKVYNQYSDVSYLKLKDLKGCEKSLVKTFVEQAKKYGYNLK